jgi:Ser/Thr protein kinase RdoA (MazF antagonist)
MELLEINNISLRYGLETKDFKTLSERATLIITGSEERFILKKKGNLEQINSELKLLKHLQKFNILTQFPIINELGEYITSDQYNNYCLYNYLEGKTFSSAECLQNPLVPKLLGETIAILNKALKTIEFSEEFPNKDLYQIVYSFAVKQIEKVDQSEQLLNVYKHLEDDIKTVINSLPKQVVHRDTHIHNIVYNEDILTGIIDFEIVEVNVNIFDICYCSTSVLSEVFSDETLRETWLTFVGDLVTSYNRYNSLTTTEIKSIWYVMLCIQSVFMAFFSNNKDIYHINKAMFIWIYENRSNLENKLLIRLT